MELRNPLTPRRDRKNCQRTHRNVTVEDRRHLPTFVFESIHLRWVVAIFVLTCFLVSGRAANAAIILGVNPLGSPEDYGAGARGLYLGHDFTHTTHRLTNFEFQDMVMVINEVTGDAEMSGTMRRRGGPYLERNWEIDSLKLMDVEFKFPNDRYLDDMNYDPVGNALTFEMLRDVANGINPFGGQDWSDISHWGFEWKFLTMDLNQVYGDSSIPLTDWTGFAMPDMGHQLVAEAHYIEGYGLTFAAWYQNIPAMESGGYYDTGDTKSILSYIGRKPDPHVNPAPEPSAIAMAAVGSLMLVVLGYRRVRRQT